MVRLKPELIFETMPGTALENGELCSREKGSSGRERLCLGGLSCGLIEHHYNYSREEGFSSFLTSPTTIFLYLTYAQGFVISTKE